MRGSDEVTRHAITDRADYVIGDAVEVLRTYRDSAAAIFLDDAFLHPRGVEQDGLSYALHPFDEPQETDVAAGTTTSTAIIDACHDALLDGGWLLADVDDWLLPRLIGYLQSEWGDVAESLDAGGYHGTGGVTYVDSTGEPDTSTYGTHLSTGGYSVVFAHKGATSRRTDVSARQLAQWPKQDFGRGGRAKPIDPYARWIDGLVSRDELILVPCAGTAPAALAAIRVFGNAARFVCIDADEAAYTAFMHRKAAEIGE